MLYCFLFLYSLFCFETWKNDRLKDVTCICLGLLLNLPELCRMLQRSPTKAQNMMSTLRGESFFRALLPLPYLLNLGSAAAATFQTHLCKLGCFIYIALPGPPLFLCTFRKCHSWRKWSSRQTGSSLYQAQHTEMLFKEKSTHTSSISLSFFHRMLNWSGLL